MPKSFLYSALSLPCHCPVRAGHQAPPTQPYRRHLRSSLSKELGVKRWTPLALGERTAEASPPPSPALPGKGPESGCGWEGGLVRLVSQAGGGTACLWAVLAGAAVAIGWGAGPRELGQGGAGKVQVLESCGTQILSQTHLAQEPGQYLGQRKGCSRGAAQTGWGHLGWRPRKELTGRQILREMRGFSWTPHSRASRTRFFGLLDGGVRSAHVGRGPRVLVSCLALLL